MGFHVLLFLSTCPENLLWSIGKPPGQLGGGGVHNGEEAKTPYVNQNLLMGCWISLNVWIYPPLFGFLYAPTHIQWMVQDLFTFMF